MSDEARRQIVGQTVRQERVRLSVIGAIVVLYSVANVIGYRDTYRTPADRVRFASAFSGNPVLRLFYGVPHDLASVAGYAEFRLVGLLSIVLGGWGIFAAVRALRGEEDAGRYELLLAGTVTRRGAAGAVLLALALECVALWAVSAAALLAVATSEGDMSAGTALLLALALVLPATLFAGIAALASQVAPTHRAAQAVGAAILALSLLARILADLVSGWGALRWATPLGWAELMRPVTGPSLVACVLLIVASVLTAGAVLVVADRRDVATGLLARHRTSRSKFFLLGSPETAAIRSEAPILAVWVVAAGSFALIIGGFAQRIAREANASNLHPFRGTVMNGTGYLALTFVFFGVIVGLFAASHVGSIRDEESSGRLETLFALPVGRLGWLGGRVAIAAASTCLLAVLIGACAWLGSVVANGGAGARSLLEAGANTLPASLLFLGIGILLFALAPRQSAGGVLAVVGAAFLWELVGALVSAPAWMLDVSPFHHVSQVPLHAFDVRGAVVMLVLAGTFAATGIRVFMRRDLASG